MPRKKGSKFPHSEETKQKISISNKGKIYLWKGGKTHNAKGYILIYDPIHPHSYNNRYVLEHILIMEKQLGRYLTKEEVVHHINCKKDDNRPENLMLFSNGGEHIRYHKIMKLKRYHRIVNTISKPRKDSGKQVKCLRCGRSWFPRGLNRPGRCPECGSAIWDRPLLP